MSQVHGHKNNVFEPLAMDFSTIESAGPAETEDF